MKSNKMDATFAGLKYPKLDGIEVSDDYDEEGEEEDDEEEEEDGESAESGSTSSFSLQECINEFRARRIRRVSTHSRERDMTEQVQSAAQPAAADAHLINQNRCNKAQERKGKPCKNGFCYCFTSDSGDCASTAPPPREWHVRQQKRSRRTETNKANLTQPPPPANQRRLSSQPKQLTVPTTTVGGRPLTAISSLHAVDKDAPLIHIIQELRDNCVISEIRVNREKLPQSTHSLQPKQSNPKQQRVKRMQSDQCIEYQPTAPVLSNISEKETELSDALPTSPLAGNSPRRSSSSNGGRLLQKRLSQGQVSFKARDVLLPPPKPPRRSAQSLDGKVSLSSLSSTTPSLREAERVLDEFLRKRGVPLPKEQIKTKSPHKRKSYPAAERLKPVCELPLPSCPSLSDLERAVESKRGTHYAKNISSVADKPLKHIQLGWTEPKINDMLNCDVNKQTQFKTLAAEPAPQAPSSIGWQLPVVPKVSLDTVDGLSSNLARNLEHKHTPIKYHTSQKFIWGEQWRNLSPKTGNLGKKSKKFLNKSKNKILRFVSPKKSNREEQRSQPPEQRTPVKLCTVGVQTSSISLQSSQSPPGSYHSPVQSTTLSSSQQPQYKESSTTQQYFDFERQVKPPTPPKKLPRAQRARKLNFQSEATAPAPSYRSYHKDLDKDVSISKMGYLLSNIRAKLEASDERAMRTFRECSSFAPLEQTATTSHGFDCIDGPRSRTRRQVAQQRRELDSEPIYSEIEEDCIHISGSPQFDVRTEAQIALANATPTSTLASTTTVMVKENTARPTPTSPATDSSAIYAQVQKRKKSTTAAEPRPLGQCLQESLLNGSFFQFMPLPSEPSSDSSYCHPNPITEQPTLPLHQSLNNISEKHSPPKKNRNLSKSELSLQRSEIFLENLCRSEIVLDQQDNLRLEKVQNTAVDTDAVSYDLPNELYADYAVNEANASGSCYTTHNQSQYGSVQLEPPPPSSDNQSTPKKHHQRFTTKPNQSLSIDINDGPTVHAQNVSQSCPSTPQQPNLPSSLQPAHSSLGELTATLPNESQLLSVSALARYRLLKDAVRRSYRKGKHFILSEKQRLTHSLSFSRDQSNQTDGDMDSSTYYASFNLDSLLNESLSTNEQLAQAVNICRQLPELEISAEMVEAERLLLFAALQHKQPAAVEQQLRHNREAQALLIDGMRLPVKADASQDMFFNYYYICTFECDGQIHSTQSVECQQGAAVFRDCGLEFYSSSQAQGLELRCQIFMLRLRKVSTLALEPAKTQLQRSASASSSSSSQCDQIVSRFRLHASFKLQAQDLRPFELVLSETKSSNKLCLRSSSSWQLPLTTHTKSSNLMPQLQLTARVELRLPKRQHSGYLHVQLADHKHNWNRRWCSLQGLSLEICTHEQNLNEEPPLLALSLQLCAQQELSVAPREMCARARSFYLLCGEDAAVYFAADTQAELEAWLRELNEALSIKQHWLSCN
ncbi:uncharacterized protein LOC108596962 [Drosophila busckii]|uniref:uncharacterized protein LOC108596962 n=1 Tax=Drosophila busckii TaxID=30019 RepID=UPI00083F32A7|nr:uncharacterized protein LOC108596962 [Drosophila busckii]